VAVQIFGASRGRCATSQRDATAEHAHELEAPHAPILAPTATGQRRWPPSPCDDGPDAAGPSASTASRSAEPHQARTRERQAPPDCPRSRLRSHERATNRCGLRVVVVVHGREIIRSFGCRPQTRRAPTTDAPRNNQCTTTSPAADSILRPAAEVIDPRVVTAQTTPGRQGMRFFAGAPGAPSAAVTRSSLHGGARQLALLIVVAFIVLLLIRRRCRAGGA
jgi:hypothetical protein